MIALRMLLPSLATLRNCGPNFLCVQRITQRYLRVGTFHLLSMELFVRGREEFDLSGTDGVGAVVA